MKKQSKINPKLSWDEFTLSPEVYPVKIKLYIGEKIELIKNEFSELYGFNGQEDVTPVDGLCCCKDSNFGVFVDKDWISHGLIAHELFHLTSSVLEYVGLELDSSSEEAYAHFNEFLTTWAYKKIATLDLDIETIE